MSLRVWLPLVRDIDNQGLDDLSITNSGATLTTGGKLGGCYNFVGTYLQFPKMLPTTCSQFSVAGWVKLNSGYATNNGFHLISFQETYSRICISKDGLAVRVLLHKDSTSYTGGSSSVASTLTAGVWNHYAVTFDNGVIKVYINGQLDSTATASITSVTLTPSAFRIGTYATENANGCANDIRIYDTCISAKEVKLLSQGLVCHYKLDDIYATDNLIPNGYGQDGAAGWNNSTNFSTSEIPSGHPEIKASFYAGNATTTFIPISQGTTYTLSAYLKANGSGTSYPSIFPYDADKHIINYYNCADGFSNSYRTTLAQPLKKGDTVIYATDLSAWTTGVNHYYHVAIFGYKDSQGRVYPNMRYTYDSPVFGTRTDKSHINKTNNTITLNSAFTGEDRPAGTVICQATEGSTYYYPFGAVNTSSVSDWTLKTAVLSPSTTNRLKYAKYINYMAYSGLYHAGIKLVDNNFSESYIYDSSGYNNHGTRIGGLTVSTNTARNTLSTKFVNGSYIQWANISPTGYANTYTFAWWGKFTIANGTMQWGFANGNRLNLYMYNTNCYWNTGNGTSNPFNVALSAYGDNNWHHFAITGDGTTSKLYLDGEYKGSATTYVGITGTTLIFNGWDTGNSYNFNGSLSDFRLYATALSAEDIQQLYNAPVSVSNNGAIFTQGEFIET